MMTGAFCPLFLIAANALGFGTFLLLLVIFIKSDCNILLKFSEKFGKSPSTLKGQVCWITGASSGIGEHLAYKLASHGVKLVLSSRKKENLEEVKRRCLLSSQLKDEDILVVPFDIQDDSVLEECTKKVLDHFGQIDILVNNAGRPQRAQFVDIGIVVDRELFETNVFGSISLTRHVLRHMLPRKRGRILVTSSAAGKIGAPNSASYTGSKHALQSYYGCLRSELSEKGIKVCIACPGPVFSRFLENAATSKPGEVYGEKHKLTDKRMKTERCAELMATAMANDLNEVWISLQPFLTIFYFAQYTPTLWTWLTCTSFFQNLANRVREGRY